MDEDILNGRYGRLLESIIRPERNDLDTQVDWPLEKCKRDDLKLVIIDADTGP